MPQPSANTTPAEPTPASFEQALEELEGLVAALEGGNLPLAEALSAYERGAKLVHYAQGELSRVEQQVRRLDGANLVPLERGESDASSP